MEEKLSLKYLVLSGKAYEIIKKDDYLFAHFMYITSIIKYVIAAQLKP